MRPAGISVVFQRPPLIARALKAGEYLPLRLCNEIMKESSGVVTDGKFGTCIRTTLGFQ